MSLSNPLVTKIELIQFTIRVPNIESDPGGAGVFYVPGPGSDQVRFGVRIETDAGVTGEYLPPRGRAKATMGHCEALAHILIGKPALQREKLYGLMRKATKHVGENGIGPLDVALWDFAGKLHDTPIYSMMGGYRTQLPTYASTLTGDRRPDGLSSPEVYAEFAQQCLDMGYPAYKIHGFKEGDPDEEIAIITAVAKQVGGKMQMMYDSGCNIQTFAGALKVGRALDECGYLWYEDPYAEGGVSIHGNKTLRKLLKTPIMITEHVKNPEQNADIMMQGGTDYGRADPDYDCGLTGCMKIARVAEGLGLDCEVHSMGPAMRHMMAATRNCNYYEMNLVHPKLPNAWALPVYQNYDDDLNSIDKQGNVPVPTGPGLGISYDWDAIRKNTLASVVVGG